ncbi:hypothetical protein PVK06_023177 [Gossypium arboreum]|uniref:Uncharacterized protein n=1 Tax=Gossypium arboreum TaxID=29729 RepID=A0ABR0PAJ3_GOSAR|nr:hypothetical protein PVK06_023177 [Gossypium arboreum]
MGLNSTSKSPRRNDKGLRPEARFFEQSQPMVANGRRQPISRLSVNHHQGRP